VVMLGMTPSRTIHIANMGYPNGTIFLNVNCKFFRIAPPARDKDATHLQSAWHLYHALRICMTPRIIAAFEETFHRNVFTMY